MCGFHFKILYDSSFLTFYFMRFSIYIYFKNHFRLHQDKIPKLSQLQSQVKQVWFCEAESCSLRHWLPTANGNKRRKHKKQESKDKGKAKELKADGASVNLSCSSLLARVWWVPFTRGLTVWSVIPRQVVKCVIRFLPVIVQQNIFKLFTPLWPNSQSV